MRPVFHTFLALLAPAALAAPLQLQFVGVDGKGIAATVVTLRSTDAARPVAKPTAAVMDQVDRQFVPHVLVIPLGSQVVFPNSDSVAHQVYSFSPANKFQLPLYRGKPPPPVLFGREGLVTLGCNIHDQMRAYVYVVQAQYFGRTDAEGSWSVADVEPGEYKIEIWHPLSRTVRPVLEQTVKIPANGARLTLRAAAPLRLRSESQLPSNWDVY
ncbi:MAG TPA: methylamine utilization protein [Steroidobacteraceae bacterium]|nr:methylamine utilization protein [Steroidobacteraceae bacterium]